MTTPLSECPTKKRKRHGEDHHTGKRGPKSRKLALITPPAGYTITSKLGSGGQSQVSKVLRISDGREFACKSTPIRSLRRKHDRGLHLMAAGEAVMLAKLRDCQGVIGFEEFIDIHSSSSNSGWCHLICELGSSCLAERIAQHPISEPEAAFIIRSLAETLHRLHQRGVLHRDIKPDNVLLLGSSPQSLQVKLGDFGLAVNMTKHGIYDEGGTPNYRAPETYQTQHYESSDVYGLGLVLFEMLAREVPFGSKARDTDFRAAVERIAEMPKLQWGNLKNRVSAEAQNLITNMTRFERHERLTIEEVINNSWVTNNARQWDCSVQSNL